MSSKKFVYLFMMVAIVCGFVVADPAYGQSVPIVTFKGDVLNADGTPAPGYALSAETVPSNAAYQDFGGSLSHTDGSYAISIGSIGGPQLSVGDKIKITATDVEGSDTEHIHTLTVEDVVDNVGNVQLDLIIRGVTVTVDVAPSVFNADSTETGTVTVTVDRDGPVTDDTVTLSLSPAVGSITSPATNNGDGTYSATYTSGTTTGNVRITATATQVGGSGTASVIINAGSPAAIELSATPETVASFGRAVITAMVTDSNGNGVGALTPTGTASSGGTLSNFTAARAFGSYTATYTAPMVDAEGTETVTVMADGVSGDLTLNLTPVPPEEVGILIVEGPVYRADGEAIVDSGVAVEVTVGSNAPQTGQTNMAGMYSVTFFSPGADVVARGGDPVSIVVTDATGGTHGPYQSVLTNEELVDDPATVTREVTTGIPVPPRSVSILAVEGIVTRDDDESPADGVSVMVTVGSNAPQTAETDMAGMYSVTFFTPNVDVIASKDDPVSIVVTDATGGTHGPYESVLTYTELGEGDTATVTRNLKTTIPVPPRSVSILVVEGVALRDDETTPVGVGYDVAVTVGSNAPQTVQTDAAGAFSVTFFMPGTTVATTGDMLSIVVSDSSGIRGESPARALKNSDLGEADTVTVEQDVVTNVGATSTILAVMGTVYLKNGETQKVPATNDLRTENLTVVVANTTRDLEQRGSVHNDGKYSVTFFDVSNTVAETGDSLTVEIQNEAGEIVGTTSHILTTAEITAVQADGVDVDTTVLAVIKLLDVVGSVVEIDGSPAGAGLAVTIMLTRNGHTVELLRGMTDAAGRYNRTFFSTAAPVASTGDTLTVEVRRKVDQFVGYQVVELRSAELADRKITVKPVELRPPELKLGGLSIDPHYTGIEDASIQELLSLDLAGLAAAGATIVDPSGDLLGTLPPSLAILIAPVLSVIGTLQLELPKEGFDVGGENIDMESFGNAITTRPTAWAAFEVEERHPGRWINGNQLHLYISGAPTIESVTFTLGGQVASGTSVPEGGSFPYTFQLEEEWVALSSGAMEVFDAVTLIIDGHGSTDMMRGDGGVWSAEVMLPPGSQVSYYYMITLSEPYYDAINGVTVTQFPFLDPLNRQVKTANLLQGLNTLLSSELAGDPQARSVFNVPAVDYKQSLWVGKFDLDTDGMYQDGMYQLDVNVSYRGGYQEDIPGKTLYVDRIAPTANAALHLDAPGNNAGLYSPADGYYVATGIMPGEASLTVSAEPHGPENAGYIYQVAALDALGQPGAWNPVVTSDLLPLDLVTLLTDPASVIPVTVAPPHRVEMLISNSADTDLIGTYGLRTVGIDSLLNMDSARGPDLIVELVAPDRDIVEVSAVQSDFDGNGVIEGLETQSAAGDIVIFSDSIVTLVADVFARTRHPLVSIALEYQVLGSGWIPIDMITGDQADALARGDRLTVPLPVPDIPVLPDRGGHVMLRTTTTNALNVVHKQVLTAAYERRTPPDISAIYTYVTDRNPDSGAPQGLLTVSAFTQAMTAPNATAVQFEIRRSADADWMPLGIVQIANTTVTSLVQTAIIEDLISSIVEGGASTASISVASAAPISLLHREWSHTFDSAELEDTILDDTPAASAVSLDENPYVVRAFAVDAASTRYESAEGVGDSFSLDNYSPTTITEVADEVEMVTPRADDSYYVSGLIHESVPDPMLTLTARTGAHPNAFIGGIALAVNDASGAAVEIPETAFSRTGAHTYTGAFNVGSIPNGTYTFMAVAHTADGAPEDRIVAMAITVEVGNFTPPENFADPTVDIVRVINTRGDANSPSEIDAMYTAGFSAIDEEVCATLIVPNVSAGDLDVLIGDALMSAAAMGAITINHIAEMNELEICIDTAGLEEGMYSLAGLVSKPNGSIQFGLPSIRTDRTGPVVEIVSPIERHQVTTLPTIHATFTDASGFDVTQTDPMPVVITLTRLADEGEIEVTETLIRLTAAEAGEILTRSGDIAYTHDDPVVGGAYRVGVTATDALGNSTTATPVEFTVEGVQPTVSIVSPVAGRIIDPRQPLIISVALTGNGDITVTEFQINDNDLEGTVEDNWLTHTLQPPLVGGDDSIVQRGSDNTISVKIVDSEGRTAEGSTSFAVSLDDTAPMISGPAPTGDITRKIGRVTATVTDNESDITRIQFAIDDNPLQDLSFSAGRVVNVGGGTEVQGQTNYNFFDAPLGTHTVTIVAESTGGSTTLNWEFTIVSPDSKPPEVVTYSPVGIIRTDRPVLAATVSDESGFARGWYHAYPCGCPR